MGRFTTTPVKDDEDDDDYTDDNFDQMADKLSQPTAYKIVLGCVKGENTDLDVLLWRGAGENSAQNIERYSSAGGVQQDFSARKPSSEDAKAQVGV